MKMLTQTVLQQQYSRPEWYYTVYENVNRNVTTAAIFTVRMVLHDV